MRRCAILLASLLLCAPSLAAQAQDVVTMTFDEAGFPGLHSQWSPEIVPGARDRALRPMDTTWWEQPLQLEGSRFSECPSGWRWRAILPTAKPRPARRRPPPS